MRIVQSMESARAFAKVLTANLCNPFKNYCGNRLTHCVQTKMCSLPVFVKAVKSVGTGILKSNQLWYNIIAGDSSFLHRKTEQRIGKEGSYGVEATAILSESCAKE